MTFFSTLSDTSYKQEKHIKGHDEEEGRKKSENRVGKDGVGKKLQAPETSEAMNTENSTEALRERTWKKRTEVRVRGEPSTLHNMVAKYNMVSDLLSPIGHEASSESENDIRLTALRGLFLRENLRRKNLKVVLHSFLLHQIPSILLDKKRERDAQKRRIRENAKILLIHLFDESSSDFHISISSCHNQSEIYRSHYHK